MNDDNPFDTGLPFLRGAPTDPPPTGKRRRTQTGRPRRQSRPRPRRPIEDVPEGSWEDWLATPAQAEPVSEPGPRITPNSMFDPDDTTTTDPAPAVLIDRTGDATARRRAHHGEGGERSGRRSSLLILTGVGVVVAAAVGTVVYTSSHDRDAEPAPVRAEAGPSPTLVEAAPPNMDPSIPPASTTTAAPSPDPVASDGCRQSRSPDAVSGTGAGSYASGPDAILLFNRVYYAERDGGAAARVLADGATVLDVDGNIRQLTGAELQRGAVEQTPAGTRYCVQITRAAGSTGTGEQTWDVLLSHQKPEQDTPSVEHQIVTTGQDPDGRTRITHIAAA